MVTYENTNLSICAFPSYPGPATQSSVLAALREADSVTMTTGAVSGSTWCVVAVAISCGINGAGVSPVGAP